MAVMPVGVLIFFVSSGLFCALGLVAAVVAWGKGYRPWFWVAALGPVGALLILLRPPLSRATTPEERDQWEQRADWTGGILSGITLFLAMGLPILAMTAIYSLRSVVVARPAAAIVAPAPPVTYKVEEMPVAEPQDSSAESVDATLPENQREPSSSGHNGQTESP